MRHHTCGITRSPAAHAARLSPHLGISHSHSRLSTPEVRDKLDTATGYLAQQSDREPTLTHFPRLIPLGMAELPCVFCSHSHGPSDEILLLTSLPSSEMNCHSAASRAISLA